MSQASALAWDMKARVNSAVNTHANLECLPRVTWPVSTGQERAPNALQTSDAVSLVRRSARGRLARNEHPSIIKFATNGMTVTI
ncbi:hypothetical protein BDI4_620030 [Burkholderia diffusa]|nr:hypothetical protein BDI4_620030 [Burkholderia diffusa]